METKLLFFLSYTISAYCSARLSITYVTPFIWTGVLVVRRSTMSLTTNFQWLLNGCNLKKTSYNGKRKETHNTS